MDRNASRPFAAAIVTLIALFAAGCVVPTAPGYLVRKESRGVRFVAGPPPALEITAQYTLVNSGGCDLSFMDVTFPEERTYGRKDVRAEMDGHEIELQPLPAEYQPGDPNTLRVPLDPPWKRGQTHDLSISYTLSSSDSAGARITIGANDFHLGSRGWSPQLLPPKHLFAPYPGRPKITAYTIRVPSDFMVLARGTLKKRKQEGSETTYIFALRSSDLAPYVVAGRYTAWPAKPTAQSAVFWTVQPLTGDPAPAAARITEAWNTLETDFGPLDKNILAPHIVESSGLRGPQPDEQGPVATAFPGGVLVSPATLALGTGSDQFLDAVSHALAHNWFGDEMYPRPEAALGLGEGLPEYATIVIDEAQGGAAARRRRIAGYLQDYDEAKKDGNETTLAVTTLNSPEEQRRIALAKAPLFFIAIEDACGAAQTRAGLARMVTLLRGQEVSYNDLRAALEESSGRHLGDLFREWLNEKGIPQDFRERYPSAPAGSQGAD